VRRAHLCRRAGPNAKVAQLLLTKHICNANYKFGALLFQTTGAVKRKQIVPTTYDKMVAITTIISFALLVSTVSALDLILKDVECDDLPIALVDNYMTIECEGGPRCSLGKEAFLHGKRKSMQNKNKLCP
jgi:hypothetical protein